MPENIRALIVLLFLSSIVFAFAKRPACFLAMTEADFNRRRNLWYGVTLCAFLAHNFWIFIIFSGVLIYFGCQREENKLAMYFFLLFAVPMLQKDLRLFGIYFVDINYVRLLSVLVLFPALMSLNKSPIKVPKLGGHLQDKILLLYLFLLFVLFFQTIYLAQFFRQNVLYVFTDIFLPYYVASRILNNLQDFRDALMSFVVACLVLSLVAVFESLRHWLLYASLKEALEVSWGFGKYLSRGAFLRAIGTPGQAIALGYVIAVAIGLCLYFGKSCGRPTVWRVALGLLFFGCVAALSRGPWVGAAIMVIVFVWTGPNGTVGLLGLGCILFLMVVLIAITPYGSGLVDYLPFVGSIDSRNVEFRERLLPEVTAIIMKNPLFGSRDLDLEQFRTGEGVVDIVNTYLIVGLKSGLVGLGLFASFFLTICLGIYQVLSRLPDKNAELYRLGRTLLAVLIGIILIIFTVSSVTVIPYVFWSMAGVGVAYIRMIKRIRKEGGMNEDYYFNDKL